MDPLSSETIPAAPSRGIALFDLDGTLVAWDCQLLFRRFVVGKEPWRMVFLPLFLIFTPLAGVLGAEGMKRIFLSYLWKLDDITLREYCREFAASLMPSIYPELRKALEDHRLAGDYLILASASPECYVVEIGRMLGFDLSLGTPVEFGPLFPDLENHKGEAKVERLESLLPESWFDGGKLLRCHGYTDSEADLPMLRLCHAVTVVNPSARLTQRAHQSGWHIVRPVRPWKSTIGKVVRIVGMLFGIGSIR